MSNAGQSQTSPVHEKGTPAVPSTFESNRNESDFQDLNEFFKKNSQFKLSTTTNVIRAAFVVGVLGVIGLVWWYSSPSVEFLKSVSHKEATLGDWLILGRGGLGTITILSLALYLVKSFAQWYKLQRDIELSLLKLNIALLRSRWLLALASRWGELFGKPASPEAISQLMTPWELQINSNDHGDESPLAQVINSIFGSCVDGKLKLGNAEIQLKRRTPGTGHTGIAKD